MKAYIASSRPTQDQKQICFAGSDPIGPRKVKLDHDSPGHELAMCILFLGKIKIK
ncbi:uncharacterized protein PHALS_11300 [Plasmopara halstedii]|uniref:Uncharacterized protein n=1 Tax=Plasmopara halstedii TaxID=4781 RepID=A0A0P1AIJ0_PLAHL|nr:uncharacterized protein PHALS_11300 [Plasmopara halstedii]CEG41135.1 hypothetical protein PHALS_11300 [Plasmopara halstedii]|eukprot:XP_024577504.1 hypothetical protein PHALS_11300 [Plasmopara halstedii]